MRCRTEWNTSQRGRDLPVRCRVRRRHCPGDAVVRRPSPPTFHPTVHGHRVPSAVDADRVWPAGVDALREFGFHVAALALEEDSVAIREFAADAPERTAIVFGTEGDGLRRSTIAACDSTVMIPMSGGVESLNVAAASAVACFALQTEPAAAL